MNRQIKISVTESDLLRTYGIITKIEIRTDILTGEAYFHASLRKMPMDITINRIDDVIRGFKIVHQFNVRREYFNPQQTWFDGEMNSVLNQSSLQI